MGHWKNVAIERMNEERDARIADLLGISADDLAVLDYEIETDESNDGLIYGYRIVFNKDASPKKILKKIKDLEDGNQVYLQPWDLDDSYDYEEQYDAIIENKNHLDRFHEEIKNLKSLNSLPIADPELKRILIRQLYISVIGTMETFLSDTFINLTNDNEGFFRNFVETHPDFKKRKFELREIFGEYEQIRATAKTIMLETIYHNLPIIREMFISTFKIKFPSIKDVYKCVLARHDLVHRNGKTKEGETIELTSEAFEDVSTKVSKFVEEIAIELGLKPSIEISSSDIF